MNMRDLIPWGRERSVPSYQAADPFLTLHREMNRLFDDVFRGFDDRLPAFGSLSSFNGVAWPNVEISDSDKEINVTAEIPGLEEKDIEVLLNDGVLTLRGEKRSEVEDNEKALRQRQEELETQLLAVPAESWSEAVGKARYLLGLLASTSIAQDPRRQKLIANLLEDFARLSRAEGEEQTD